MIEEQLIGTECNGVGKLSIDLREGRELIQNGPHLIPPIRWINSFELTAEFKIICLCDKVNDEEEFEHSGSIEYIEDLENEFKSRNSSRSQILC